MSLNPPPGTTINKALKKSAALKLAIAPALLLPCLILMIAAPAREGPAQNDGGSDMRVKPGGPLVKLSFGNEEIFIRMRDHAASREFLKLPPLSLPLEDYRRTEKISSPPRKLNIQNAPGGSDPVIGDFHRDFGYSIWDGSSPAWTKLTGPPGDFDARRELAE